jgi:hypothetical protein
VLLEASVVAIHPKFQELTTVLKNVKATDDHLDKNFVYSDLYDGYRLAIYYAKREPKQLLLAEQAKMSCLMSVTSSAIFYFFILSY